MSLEHFAGITAIVKGCPSSKDRKRNRKTHCFDLLNHVQGQTYGRNVFEENLQRATRHMKKMKQSKKVRGSIQGSIRGSTTAPPMQIERPPVEGTFVVAPVDEVPQVPHEQVVWG